MGACATAWAPFIFLEEEKNNEKQMYKMWKRNYKSYKNS